jgi:predicted dehydrogenase
VIGCGFFAANHLQGWADLGGVEIVAVCDRDRARAEAAAARFGIGRVHDDAAAMLAAERPDFVDIVTTVESHKALVELAAGAGVAAICQKPFACDLAEGRAMVAACERAGVPLMVHENFRWQSPLLAVKAAIDAGRIGRPTYGRISFRHAYDIYANQPYLLTEPRLAIQDLGIHLLDLARFYLGEASRLYCRTQRLNPKVTGEDSAVVVLDHLGGAVSLVDFSFWTKAEPDPFPETLVRIEGDLGTIELDQGYRLAISRPGEREERQVEPAVPAWGAKPWHNIQESVVNIQRHWLECLRTGQAPATSGADNLKTLELVLAAYDSAARGRALPLGEG